MPFNLDQFRNTISSGGARPTLFEMFINWPSSVASGRVASSLSRFMVHVSAIPTSQVGMIEIPYFGRKIKVMGDRVFQPLTVQLFNDENFALRKAFEEWMDRMAGHRSATSQYRGGNTDGGYTTDLELVQYGRQGDVLRTYNFVGAFPTNLAEIPLDWNTTDQIQTYAVEFQYQWWEVKGQIPTRDNPTINVDVTVNAGG